jgi:hypothetical protein
MNYLVYAFLIVGLIWWTELPSLFLHNSLIMRKNPAEDLEAWLKKFHLGSRDQLKDLGQIPRYKFYGDIIGLLLDLARKIGGTYQEAFLFLREGLQSDRQFEKKIRESLVGIWLQLGLLMALTWGFIGAAQVLVQVTVPLSKLMLIFLWQVLGLATLPLILKFLRQRYFGPLGKLWQCLFVLKALMKAPLARSEIFSIAGMQHLSEINHKNLSPIVERLREACQRTLKEGKSYEEEVAHLMNELRFQERWHFEIFEKRLTVIKLLLLSVFFLPSYLAFIFFLIGDLMALM